MNKFQAFDDEPATGEQHQGFSLAFANGFTVSVAWDRKAGRLMGTGKDKAEVALINTATGKFIKLWGFQTPEDVTNIMYKIKDGVVPEGGMEPN